MRHCLVMADKVAKLTFVVSKLITNQWVTPIPPHPYESISLILAYAGRQIAKLEPFIHF